MSEFGPQNKRAIEAATFFDGSRLTLARQLAGLRKSDLAALMEKSATAIAAWESGAKRPTPATVATLSLTLSVDPGFFSARPRNVAAVSATPHFRSLRATTQLARDQASAYGHLAVDMAASIERHVEFPEPTVPSFPISLDDSDGGPERAAKGVRDEWGLGHGPVGHIVRLLENNGILVVFSPPQSAGVDAYSFDSHLRPVVVLNPLKRDYYRQRFDVAHELGHLVMHGDAEPGGRDVEEQAHRFASEFLMPAAEISDQLPTSINGRAWQALARLKEQWGVSIQALLFRARFLGRLSDVSYRNAMATLSARGWRRDEPGLVEAVEQPSLLPSAVELLAAEGIDDGQLLAQCRVPRSIFRTVTSRRPEIDDESEDVSSSESPDRTRRVVSLLRP